MEEKPNYFAVIPAEVRYDATLKDKAKLLYGEIMALTNKEGYCWASNKYFAELYNLSITTISLLIKDLVEKGYLESEIIYKENSKEISSRYLRIVKGGYLSYVKEGYLSYVKGNNININNTSINKKENIKRKVFKKPTIEEIQAYCIKRNNGINAEAFYDFYESKDWYVGKNKMKDWQACVRTWEKRDNKNIKKEPKWFGKEIEQEAPSDKEREEMELLLRG